MAIKRKKSKTPIQRSKVSKKKSVLKSKVKKLVKNKKSSGDLVALIDIEIILYHVCLDCLEEKKTRDDEWSWILNEKDAQEMMTTRIEQVLMETGANRCILYFGSQSNWRKKLEPSYKAHRTDKKPLGYNMLREWCKQEYPSQERPFLEADDLIGIVHTKVNPKRETIAVSSDKDFKCLPGKLFNPTKADEGIVTISKTEADNWHLYQTIVGDTADGYKGCPGAGAVAANKLINNKKLSYAEKWKELVAMFKKAGLTEKDALLQARLARICRSENYDLVSGELTLWKAPKLK